MLRYLSLIYQASQIAMSAYNLFTLPRKPLFSYVTALLSPSYSIVSCRWSWRLLHVGSGLCWDIIISLILINASIYLVKGGRLVLMPGVLFHSCRPSFRLTGVMFLDFASLTRCGFMGPSWQFTLNKTLTARPNIGFNISHNNTWTYWLIGIGRREPEDFFYIQGVASADGVGPKLE